MNLLLFNLAMDADDPILAFTTDWANRLAAHYDAVDVLTMRAGRVQAAPNMRVYSVGKEIGRSEPRRASAFYAALNRLLNERRYDACFAHMMPLFALMSAPLLGPRRVPITVWYTHRSQHWTARRSIAIARRIVTAAPDTFPFPTHKLRVTGHGIDTARFAPQGDRSGRHIAYVARISPIKHHETLIAALAAVPGATAELIGARPSADDTYETALRQQIDALGLDERVRFTGGMPADGLVSAYGRSALSVNLSPPGLFDKAALEAMACAVPTVVSNPAFDALLGDDAPLLRIPNETDAGALAERLNALLALTPEARLAIGLRLRTAVERTHGLDALIPRLVSVINTGELP